MDVEPSAENDTALCVRCRFVHGAFTLLGCYGTFNFGLYPGPRSQTRFVGYSNVHRATLYLVVTFDALPRKVSKVRIPLKSRLVLLRCLPGLLHQRLGVLVRVYRKGSTFFSLCHIF